MPRKGPAAKRQLVTDPVYGSPLVTQLANKVLKDGKRRPLQLKEGDVVLFTSWAGDEFKQQKSREEILVMHEEDVLAVIDE